MREKVVNNYNKGAREKGEFQEIEIRFFVIFVKIYVYLLKYYYKCDIIKRVIKIRSIYMEQEIVPILRAKLENNARIYIELKQIEKMIDKKIEYAELVEIINNFICDGILKAIRKREEWQSSITFFEV